MNRLLFFLKSHPFMRRLLYVSLSITAVLVIGIGKATAQSFNNPSIDLLANIWMLVAGSLVFFMNAGFAMVETGFCRTNNATNILAKNLIVFCISALAYWMFGFGLMFGDTTALKNSFVGETGFFFDIIPAMDGFKQLQEAWPGRSLSTLFFFLTPTIYMYSI